MLMKQHASRPATLPLLLVLLPPPPSLLLLLTRLPLPPALLLLLLLLLVVVVAFVLSGAMSAPSIVSYSSPMAYRAISPPIE
jgi:hypothetical protein